MYESKPPASIDIEYLWSQRLAPLLWYLRDDERGMVREGLELAVAAHAGQRRKSGEPFVTHPVEVRMGLGKGGGLQLWGVDAAGAGVGSSRSLASCCTTIATTQSIDPPLPAPGHPHPG
jgi:hypothetical protein